MFEPSLDKKDGTRVLLAPKVSVGSQYNVIPHVCYVLKLCDYMLPYFDTSGFVSHDINIETKIDVIFIPPYIIQTIGIHDSQLNSQRNY